VPPVKYDVILQQPALRAIESRGHPGSGIRRRACAWPHDGGRDGLDIVRRLLRQARDRLAPHGIVVIEVGGRTRGDQPRVCRVGPGLASDRGWLRLCGALSSAPPHAGRRLTGSLVVRPKGCSRPYFAR
jgi:hypothetical protein